MLVEMRKLDGCDMEEFGRLESSEKTIAILGDRWWPQTAKQDGNRISKQFLCSIYIYGKIVMSAQMLEVSLLGVGTVLRLGRGAWSMVQWLRQATNEYAPPHTIYVKLAVVLARLRRSLVLSSAALHTHRRRRPSCSSNMLAPHPRPPPPRQPFTYPFYSAASPCLRWFACLSVCLSVSVDFYLARFRSCCFCTHDTCPSSRRVSQR